jgi:hypothetical protein
VQSVGSQSSGIYRRAVSWESIFWDIPPCSQLGVNLLGYTAVQSVGSQSSGIYRRAVSWESSDVSGKPFDETGVRYGEYNLLGHTAVQSVGSQETFLTNLSTPSSRYKLRKIA